MKIAYLGPINDGTGYSKAIIENILSLDEIGVDVVVRSVKMTNTSGEVPQRIKELAKNNLQGVDYVIQHNLPNEFVYSSKCQQVGRWDYETNRIPVDWIDNLRLMDKLIVSASFAKTAVKNTDPSLDEKTYVCPHAIDTSKFDKEYDLMDFGFRNKPLKFYTIAEFGMRKNLPATIAAYYSAFCSDDSVLLVIKSYISGGDVTKMIEDICNDLKRTMHKFNDPNLYPPIAVMGSYLSDDKINSLHQSCDVFVSSSRGEAFQIPYIEALGFGNPCIVPKHSAFLDYYYDTDLMVNSTDSIVFGVQGCPQGLYTSDEIWGNPSLINLAQSMRLIYDIPEPYFTKEMRQGRKGYVQQNFSRKVVGQKLMDIITGNTGNTNAK